MSELTVHVADVPEEPPAGTVVVDRDGRAWQSEKMIADHPNWNTTQSQCEFRPQSLHWPMLIVTRGPLTELYRPEAVA